MKRKSSRTTRHARVCAKIYGTKDTPRISVFRSNRHVVIQLIDDVSGRTLFCADDYSRKNENIKGKPLERAAEIGKLLARRALAHKIERAVFDRGGYKYHGIVRAIAEGARAEGLKF